MANIPKEHILKKYRANRFIRLLITEGGMIFEYSKYSMNKCPDNKLRRKMNIE